MSTADTYSSKIILFIFAVVFFCIGISLSQCGKQPDPARDFPNVLETPNLQ